ncbi:hypothetical protein OG948_13185 [Embleya sp. NBC_00888]|uniref:hypothetical protein n=1 Tax=Embleya sp. NBC_00888 TaxID=2975960 RepID=UPI003863BDC1|nr:hypothetical protein OG948_13185 [Embleya sp. NBC_00888]
MSAIAALGRLRAAATGVAQPAATVRHRHLSARPVVLVPYVLAGEAFAPLAVLVGTERERPHLLAVPQPRDRDRRFAHAAELGRLLLPYLGAFAAETETIERRGDDPYERSVDAPQVLVPTSGGVEYLRLLGRSTRFRRTEGEFAVAAEVPLLGRWSTWLADRAGVPGSSVLLAMTDLLTQMWATGQSALEDGELAALLAWIDPPAGQRGDRAAREVEGGPTAGPATDPAFDERLVPLIAAFDEAVAAERGEEAADTGVRTDLGPRGRDAENAIRDALAAELMPTWDRMWRGVELLGALPVGASVAGRWEADRASYSFFAADLADPESRPQPRVPGAISAAAQLATRERAQARLDAEQVRDDPLLMAAVRLAGEAFRGELIAVDAERMVAEPGKKTARPRPLLSFSTDDEPLFGPGTDLACVERPDAKARVLETEPGRVVLELRGGMGGGKAPKPGSVPEPGEVLCWTSLIAEFRRGPDWPAVEDTPWTHGGPPPEPEPEAAPEADDDALEEWS